MSYTINAACISHPGHVRLGNEDNFSFGCKYLLPDAKGTDSILTMEEDSTHGLFFAVFDGMGGENYGELASLAAAEEAQSWKPAIDNDISELEKFALHLNEVVVDRARSMLTSHMGTTMAALFFCNEKVFLCNVGDSRIFRLRKKELLQISQDHVEDISAFGGRLHRKPSLSQYLGVDPEEFQIEPYLWEAQMLPDDQFLICSDGLTDMVSASEISSVLISSSSVKESTEKLVETALSYGGKDNITVILCAVS